MRTINKREREELKEYTDKNFGGYEIAEFSVNVFSTDVVTGEQGKEKRQFRGEIFKNDSGDDLFTVYNEFHDGAPEWIVFSKNELADENINVLKKTSIQQEKDEELAREIARRENQQRMQEERIAESKRKFDEQSKLNEKRNQMIAEQKQKLLKEEKGEFLKEHGYLLKITDLDENKKTLNARMVDRGNKTLATFEYTSMLSYEEIEPSEGFQTLEEDGGETLYPYVADEDFLTIRDNKGNVIDDTGSVFVAKEALESLKIWKKDDLDYAIEHFVDLEEPERHIDFEDYRSSHVFRTLKDVASNPNVQRMAKLRTEYVAEQEKNKGSKRKP